MWDHLGVWESRGNHGEICSHIVARLPHVHLGNHYLTRSQMRDFPAGLFGFIRQPSNRSTAAARRASWGLHCPVGFSSAPAITSAMVNGTMRESAHAAIGPSQASAT